MLKTIAIAQIPNLNPYDTLNVSKVTAKTFIKLQKNPISIKCCSFEKINVSFHKEYQAAQLL